MSFHSRPRCRASRTGQKAASSSPRSSACIPGKSGTCKPARRLGPARSSPCGGTRRPAHRAAGRHSSRSRPTWQCSPARYAPPVFRAPAARSARWSASPRFSHTRARQAPPRPAAAAHAADGARSASHMPRARAARARRDQHTHCCGARHSARARSAPPARSCAAWTRPAFLPPPFLPPYHGGGKNASA